MPALPGGMLFLCSSNAFCNELACFIDAGDETLFVQACRKEYGREKIARS